MTVPFTFADQTGNIPLAELDANFAAVSNNVAVANTVSANAQPNITSVGTLANLSVLGNIVTGNYFIGNGSQLTGIVAISTYGNSNVAAYLPIDATISTINSNVTATNVRVANTNSNVARTNSNVANTNSNVANLTTSLANTNSDVANISANVTTLQGQVYTDANVANYLPTYTGNATANYFIGNGSLLTDLPAGSNYSNSNVQSYLEVLTSNVSTTGNVNGNNVLAGGVVSATGNVRGANLNTVGVVSATGNIIADYFIGNGSQLTNIADRTTGSWTLAPGNNTVSFTVAPGSNYTMWVNGNIPNGIVMWNATVNVSNQNVPAIGAQYGYYYTSGNALVLTAMPDQIRGVAGTISTDATYLGTTSNVFEFDIINNSGNSQVINWGYITL